MRQKVLFYMTWAAAVATAASVLVSCEQNGPDAEPGNGTSETVQLAAPVPQVTDKTGESFTVSWEAVENADYYSVSINGTETSTSQTSKVIEAEEGETYTVKVRATTTSDQYTDSEWSDELVYTFESWLTFDYETLEAGQYRIIIKGTDVVECYFAPLAESGGWSDEDIIWLLTGKDSDMMRLSDDVVAEINSAAGYSFTHKADFSGYSSCQFIVYGINGSGEAKLIRKPVE